MSNPISNLKDLENPWTTIQSGDYEQHMSHASVMQLQTLSAMVRAQYESYLPAKLAYLGVCTGNGLEHVNPAVTGTIYGFDINTEFLALCYDRFASKLKGLNLIPLDLNHAFFRDDKVDLILANLVLEFIDYERFTEQLDLLAQENTVASIIFQKKNQVGVVSNSGVEALRVLSQFHHEVDICILDESLRARAFAPIYRTQVTLLDGKEFIRVDYRKEHAAC